MLKALHKGRYRLYINLPHRMSLCKPECLCTCGIQLVIARINVFNSRIPYAHVHMAYEWHFMVATWLCVQTHFSSELTRVFEHQVWNLCLKLCIFVRGIHIPTVPIWSWVNQFDTSSVLRIFLSLSSFWFIFKNSPWRLLLTWNLPFCQAWLEFQPFKGNMRFCVCVCDANSLEQTQGQHLGFATNKIQQINHLASSPSLPLSLPPCFPFPLFSHLAEIYEIKMVKTFQGNSNLPWIIIHWIYAHHALSRQSLSHPSLATLNLLRTGTVLTCGDKQPWWQLSEAMPGWHCVTSRARRSAQQGTNAKSDSDSLWCSPAAGACASLKDFALGYTQHRGMLKEGEMMLRTRQENLEVSCKSKGTYMISDRSIITMNYQPV